MTPDPIPNNKNTMEVEMNRLRIFNENGLYYIRRKVRNDWFPVLDEKCNDLCTDDYEKAVILLNEYINK